MSGNQKTYFKRRPRNPCLKIIYLYITETGECPLDFVPFQVKPVMGYDNDDFGAGFIEQNDAIRESPPVKCIGYSLFMGKIRIDNKKELRELIYNLREFKPLYNFQFIEEGK